MPNITNNHAITYTYCHCGIFYPMLYGKTGNLQGGKMHNIAI